MSSPFRVGFLLFPDITQLDLTGPYEVLRQMPGAEVHLVWKTREPVRAAGGLSILPTVTFADSPQFDMICVPGGSGMNPLLTDQETLEFLQRQAKGARYVTSVCTGALVLGAAGLLTESAGNHWLSRGCAHSAQYLGRAGVAMERITGWVSRGYRLALSRAKCGEDVARGIHSHRVYPTAIDSGRPAFRTPASLARQKDAKFVGLTAREVKMRAVGGR